LAAASILAAAPDTHTLTPTDVDQVLEAFLPKQLAQYRIAGAVVVVVKDAGVLVSRGYGFADIEKKLPMSDETLVRPASISKLFTAVAVLQLVRRGSLDLDRDVNDYLDFRVPTPPVGTPVTLRLLLTHRAGFEEHLKGLFEPGVRRETLDEWLRQSLPHRLFPNGDVPAYSNYGYALAGYIVQRASGERFEDYTAAHLFKPLGWRDRPLSNRRRAPSRPLWRAAIHGRMPHRCRISKRSRLLPVG
jgi:CubicO group peptidase (beta-lactamase class C family)